MEGKVFRIFMGPMDTTEFVKDDLEDVRSSSLTFDAVLNENHTAKVNVTSNPIEGDSTGRISDVTDHIHRAPEEFSMTCVVSDTPSFFIGDNREFLSPVIEGTEANARARSAYEVIKDWKDRGVILFVSTLLRDYENIIITSTSVTRDKDTGNILLIDISFQRF